ncbi:MAG TPA: alpha/beta fold hydrolase [Acidimicrobiia bacterium]
MIFRFEAFELDTERFELRHEGELRRMEPQVFDVLRYLVERGERVVTKEELLDNVWGDRFVSESALTSRIKAARQALGDSGREQRFITTVHGRGYRFVAPVVTGGGTPAPGADRRDIRYARSGDVHLAYELTGGGPLDIVLVPGFVSHLELDWEDQRSAAFLERLGRMGRLIRFDKRGTGLSDRPPDLPDLETRMDDVRAVMDAAGSERAVIFGYAEGGPMAALFAATYPARVQGLVLYGTWARRIRADDYPWAPTLEERLAYAATVEAEWGSRSDIQREVPNADDAMAEWWQRRARAAASPGGARALVEMNTYIDVRDVLPTIRVPALVLHRLDDCDAHVEEGRYIAEHLPGARFVALDGTDHPPWIDAGQVLDPVEKFVTELATLEPGDADETDRALAATLFTDIVGSTDMNAQLGDAQWTALLDRHDRILRDIVEQWGGRWVKSTGDGVLAIFDGSARALRAAIAARKRLAELGIRIRAGVHASEIERRGDDVAGLGVTIAARLAALGEPGDVLTTAAVRDLIAGAGIELVERGRHALKGVPGTCVVFALATAEPARSAPATTPTPGAATPAATGNLPQPSDPFLGRTGDLARLDAAFGRSRLVTLAGPGGVGKTRLAIEHARGLDRECWFVDLSRVVDDDAVAAAFLDTLGVSPRAGVAPCDRIVENLELRSVLLVVDNCEQVLTPTAEIVARIGRDARDVAVLATSRQALGVDGEQVLVVAPLGLPAESATAREQRAADAVQVFLDRAERGGGTIDDLRSVVALCRRLDGIPLALELAAARTRAFSPAQILEQLDAGWSVSAARRDVAPARHLSLTDAIDWSYRLLDDDERELLLALSVFRGAFDVAATSAVAGSDPMTAADLLTRLVDQSLVQSASGRAGRRFRLLETVRAFAASRLDPARAIAVRDHHASYFAGRVDELGARVPGADEDDALDRLSVELDDVHAAFDHAAAAGDVDVAARLAQGPRLSLSPEGARWAHLAARACTVPGIEEHPLYETLLPSAAWSAVLVADVERARALAATGISLVGDPSNNVRLCWIWPQATGGSFSVGADGCRAGAERALEDDDRAGASFLLSTSAIYRLAAGDEHAAIDAAEHALTLARDLRSRSLRARAAGALAYALQDVDAAGARRAAEEVLEIAPPGDFHLTLPHRVLGVLAWRDRDPETAAEHAARAAALIRDQGDRYVQAAAVRQLAVTVGTVDPALAAELIGIADALLPEMRVIARDEVADERLRAVLAEALTPTRLTDLLARGRRDDARQIAATVERALQVIRTARFE